MVDERYREQARTFINETLKAVVPGLNVDGGSAVNAVFGRGAAAIGAALHQEIDHLVKARDLSRPEAMTEADMDSWLRLMLSDRDGGERAFGFVQLFYTNRARRDYGSGLTATTEDSSAFFVTTVDLSFLPQDHLLDTATGLFYINVPFVARDVGEVSNVEVGEITKILGDSSAPARVTNPSAFRGGLPKQTNIQAFRKAQRAVSTRTPLARDGTIFFLQEKFGARLLDLLVVGMGDKEMLRDELHDMGEGSEPRFAIGPEAVGGTPLGTHVGGRTDVYSLYRTINYVQQQVDVFADMILGSPLVTGDTGTITASFPAGGTGTISATGKLILNLGGASEEVVHYTSATAVAVDVYEFEFEGAVENDHAFNTTVKVVSNGRLLVGPGKDITVLPVFQIAEVRLLDPVTFEPIGDPLPETAADRREPGWYVSDVNKFDLLSAKETKTLNIDEKRAFPGNAPVSGANGATVTHANGYTQYSNPGADFTGYQGREITLSGALDAKRVILQVVSETQVLLSGEALDEAGSGVDFAVEAGYADYNQYPVRLSFYTNTEIAEVQQFLDSDVKRTISGDSLARAFLPTLIDFRLQYRGQGEEVDVREKIIDVLQTSSGEIIGESEGAQFDYSDLINAAYQDGLANYVATPFEIRVRRMNNDGTITTKWLNPGRDTINRLAVRTAAEPGDSFLDTRRPERVGEFTVPSRGRLYLGAFTANQEVVEYDAVVTSGSRHTFVLKEGVFLSYAHPEDEPLKVSVEDFDPDNVIEDGVITNERSHRPFLGNVVIEKIR